MRPVTPRSLKSKAGAFQIEKGVIAARIGDDDERGRQPALPAHQPGLEQRMTGGVGAPGRHHFIVARDQADVGLRLGGRARQRIDEDMDAVIAGKCRQAEVGYDEPLGGERTVVFAFRPRGLRGHHVDARAQIADRLVDRESRRHLGVERAFDRELPAPHVKAALVGEPLQFIATEAALEVLADDRIEQVAVPDPVDLDGDGRGVDADDRNAALAGARQHIGLGGEAHERTAVADINGEIRGLRQRLLHRRRQAGANRDAVALAVLQAFDAELLFVRRQRRLVLPGQADEWRKVDALARQLLGELEADARRGEIRIDAVVQQPEAVIVAHLFILRADIGDFAQFERQAQRVERRTPQGAVGIAASHEDQRLGLFARVGGALIGDIGGRRGAVEQRCALAVVGRPRPKDRPREAQPIRGVAGGDRDDLTEDLHAAFQVVAREGRVGITAQRRQRLRHRPGIGLDLALQADGSFGEIVSMVGLVGGKGGNARKHQQRRRQAGAHQCEHRSTSYPAEAGDQLSTTCHFMGKSCRRRGGLRRFSGSRRSSIPNRAKIRYACGCRHRRCASFIPPERPRSRAGEHQTRILREIPRPFRLC